MVEDQALDRVYRIGQKKEVTTTRYIVKNTLEEVCVGSELKCFYNIFTRAHRITDTYAL